MTPTRKGILLTIVPLALVASGVAAWRLRPQERVWLTDGRTIREPESSAQPRDILWRPAELLPDNINLPVDTYEPRVSPDGRYLYFVQRKPGENADILVAERLAQGWAPPLPLAELNTEYDELGPEPSPDGQSLYFYSNRPGGTGGYDIWVIHRAAVGWHAPTNLGPSINTEFNEYGPALTPDGETLYFASNRPQPDDRDQPNPDGWPATIREDLFRRDYDIFAASLTASGTGPAAPVRPLNTPANEGAPCVSPAGDFLYFASDRPGGQGGFDLYRARLGEDGPLVPQTLGPAINTAANELDPGLSIEGFGLYFSSDRPLPPPPRDAGRTPEHAIEQPALTASAMDASIEPAPSTGKTPPRIAPNSDNTTTSQAVPPSAAPRYQLYYTSSREVYEEAEVIERAATDWAGIWSAIWPNLLWALLALLLLLLLLALVRDLRSKRLSLLAKCLLASLLAHLLLMFLLNLWQVTARLAGAMRGRNPIQVTLVSSAAGGDITSQIRGSLVSAPEVQATTPADTQREIQIETPSTPAPALLTPARAQLTVAAVPVEAPAVRDADPASTPDAPAPAPAAPARDTRTLPDLAMPQAAAPQAVAEAADSMPTPVATQTTPANVPPVEVAVAAPTTAEFPLPRSVPAIAPNPAEPIEAAAAPDATTPPIEPPHVASEPPAPAHSPDALTLTLPPPQQQAARAEEAARSAPPPTQLTTQPAAPAIEYAAARADAQPQPAQLAPPRTIVDDRQAPFSLRVAADDASPPLVRTPTPRSDASTAPARSATPLPALRLPEAQPATAESEAVAEPQPLPRHAQLADAPRRASLPPASSHATPALVSLTPEAARPADTPTPRLDTPQLPADAAAPLPTQAPPLANLTPPRVELPALALSLPTETAPPVNPYEQRAEETRRQLVERLGGSTETEAAVARALVWLAAHQSDDGRWDARRFDDRCGRCGGESDIEVDRALTGLALLCYLAADHTHAKDGPYREHVRRGLDWLLAEQNEDGDLRGGETMYSHGIATIALSEAYGMTRDPRLAEPVRRAVAFIAAARNDRSGGWRYDPGQVGDTSVLGWQVMALKSAKLAGVEVPAEAFESAERWLGRVVQHRDGRPTGLYSYQPGRPATPAMTAEAFFVRQLLGAGREDPQADGAVALLSDNPPSWESHVNTYYWYYATLSLFQHQGPAWERWNERLTHELLDQQDRHGPAAGSWDPEGDWASVGGRIYQTALCTLMLEVYYRYLPLYAVETPVAAAAPPANPPAAAATPSVP